MGHRSAQSPARVTRYDGSGTGLGGDGGIAKNDRSCPACTSHDGYQWGMTMKAIKIGEFEQVASGIYLEGLSVDYKRDVVWYSDVIAGGIHGVRPDGRKVGSFNEGRMWTGGIMMNEDGAVLSSGQGGIMWNDPDSGRSGWLLTTIEGKPINGINEMMPDGTGGIFFGT